MIVLRCHLWTQTTIFIATAKVMRILSVAASGCLVKTGFKYVLNALVLRAASGSQKINKNKGVYSLGC